jgi:RNA polymerase sigma-70 factor (ECF subfamily)
VAWFPIVNFPETIDLSQYRDALRGHIRGILKDSTQAEDALQEVFLRAHQNLDQLHTQGAASTWLFRIATHICVDHLRKRARQPQVLDAEVDGAVTDDDYAGPSLQDLLEQREMSACVQAYLCDLATDYRAVILLHDLEGLTAAEIAIVLSITLPNAKMRLHRARESLKAALRQGCTFSCDCRGAIVCEPKSS